MQFDLIYVYSQIEKYIFVNIYLMGQLHSRGLGPGVRAAPIASSAQRYVQELEWNLYVSVDAIVIIMYSLISKNSIVDPMWY
jgi:hypothetical protein